MVRQTDGGTQADLVTGICKDKQECREDETGLQDSLAVIQQVLTAEAHVVLGTVHVIL